MASGPVGATPETTMRARIAGSIAVLVVVVCGALPLVDAAAAKHQETLLQRSLITFGLVKTLNGAISVLQGTEVAATPAGIGVSLSLGEILDPLNDLVERFSWVMLASAASLAIQQILTAITGSWAMKTVLAAAAAVLLAVMWRGRLQTPLLGPAAMRFFLLVAALRLAMPAVVLTNELVYAYFLDEPYARSTAGLEATRRSVGELSRDMAGDAPEGTLWQGLKQGYRQFESAVGLRQRLDALQEMLQGATGHVIDLIAVFLLQAILLPIGVLWALFRLVQWAGRLPHTR
jgi:hypothetical protein